MDDETREDELQPGSGMLDRLRASRAVLLVALVLAITAVLAFSVPLIAALVGMVLLVAAALAANGDVRRRIRPPRPSARSGVWPDAGIKVAVDAFGEPCFLTDYNGIIRHQNAAATERFGAPRLGDPLSFKLRVPELLSAVDAVGRGSAARRVRFTERVPTERAYQAEIAGLRTARRDRRHDRADFVLVHLRDETELARMERMRGDFIANASHELRTPLASLIGFIETLLGPARDDAVNRERFLKIMLEQAGRMSRLIDDLLSLSRIEMRAHVRPDQPVDLALIAAHVADVLGPLAREAGVTLDRQVEPGPHLVRGDRDELIQVTANLVENAIKYGRENGVVEIAIRREDGPEGLAGHVLAVRDDGLGIPSDHLPRLTERFYRVDVEDSRRRKGTGLGLAIVKHIVARHRGRLQIRSTVGEGSVFSVWLEAAPGPPLPAWPKKLMLGK